MSQVRFGQHRLQLRLEVRVELAGTHMGWKPPQSRGVHVVAEYLRQVFDQLGYVVGGPAFSALHHGLDHVEAPLHDPPKVGQAGLDLGGFILAGANVFERPPFEAIEIARVGHIGESHHRPGGYRKPGTAG